MLDYSKIGFKAGIEIHQQIKTRKLFCECPTIRRTEPPVLVTKRKLHAVASELGEYDPAALHEVIRGRTYHYESYPDTVCIVELDEEPPHPVNANALHVVLQVAQYLKMKEVDEIQVMRKTVIDGSNTAGFQRTMLVATDGIMETSEGKVKLNYLCLEEDAARIMSKGRLDINYRLDRLGMPLVEIVTGPNFVSPKQGGEVSKTLGMILRSVNIKRGIGTIRQDVNVSTNVGTRIEIKGVQDLEMIPAIMEYEARRQLALFEISQELKNKKIEPVIKDLTKIFKNTNCKVLKDIIDRNWLIKGVKLQNFKGLFKRELCPGKTLGKEFKDHVLVFELQGLMHSDELPDYGVAQSEVDKINKILQCKENDAFVIIGAPKHLIDKAINNITKRAFECIEGTPLESRRALPDGNSQYMRPLPGAARMYPETDIPPVPITGKRLDKIRQGLPELISNRFERLEKQFAVSQSQSKQMFDMGFIDVFEQVVENTSLKPNFVAAILSERMIELKRQNVAVENIEKDELLKMFNSLAEQKIAKESISCILTKLAKGFKYELENFPCASQVDAAKLIRKIVSDNKDISFQALMGIVMKELRGKIDGKAVAEMLKKEIELSNKNKA